MTIALPRWRAGRALAVVVIVTLVAAAGPPAAPAPAAPAPAPAAPIPAAPEPSAVSGSGQWPAYHHDAARSGTADPGPSLAAASTEWRSPVLDGAVYAEPVVAGPIAVVATEGDTVYGLDTSNGGTVWATHLGTPAPLSLIHSLGAPCGDIDPLGITGTPVIDTTRNEVFVAAELSRTGAVSHQLFGLDVATGRVLLAGVSLDPPGALPFAEQQRAALALGNGRVYVTYGGLAGDCGQYRGWVVSVTEAGAALVSWAVPTSREGGIWATSGPAIDASGTVWVAAGNGAQVDPSGPYDGSDSVTALTPTLGLVGQFTPAGWAADNASDLDLGSTGPELLAGHQIFQVGKSGTAYLLNAGTFGVGTEVASGPVCASFGGQAYLAPIVYVSCTDGVRAVRINPGGTGFSVVWHGPGAASGPPVVGGGLVWVVGGDHFLYGLDPGTGAVVNRLPLAATTHFTTPTVAAGVVMVATTTTVEAFGVQGSWSLWAPRAGPPPGVTGAPAVTSWGPGRLDLFVRGRDGHLWHQFQVPGGGPSAWEDLGGLLTSAPTAVSWAPGRVDVFARGTDDALWHRWWSGSAWSGWESLGGRLVTAPVAASWAAGHLDVVVPGTDGGLWQTTWSGGWSGWRSLGGRCAGSPAAVSWGPGALDVFCLGATTAPAALWHRLFRGGQWSDWLQEVPGGWVAGVSAASWALNRLDVFGVDDRTHVLTHAWWDGAGWRVELLDGVLASAPTATSWAPGRIDVFVLGTDGLLYHKAWSEPT